MNLAFTMQNFQDWFTQQWVILWGRKIDPAENDWLIGPFGELNGIGEKFIDQLAEKENLFVLRNTESKGLLNSILQLELSKQDLNRLSKNIIEFYENTSEFDLNFKVKWNPFFKVFGFLINKLFSKRINQLNIPTQNIHEPENLKSEIIELISKENHEVKYRVWLRKLESTGEIIYSGIYSTCKLSNAKTCVKAVFPLPKGNATVFLKPIVGKNNELILDSSGKGFGDAGFYFLLSDSRGIYWSQYLRLFTDKLILKEENGSLKAVQTLKIWNINVVFFNYKIVRKLHCQFHLSVASSDNQNLA